MSTSIIDVFVEQTEKKSWPLRRAQRWYWYASSAANGKELGRSSEMYTNKKDCIDCAVALFGPDVKASLHIKGESDE